MARWISPRRSDLMMPVTSTVTLGNEPLTIEQVVHIARSAPPGADYLGEPVRVEVSEAAWGRVRHTRGVIDALADEGRADGAFPEVASVAADFHPGEDER